ncbi:MAG TPA: MarR family transcriptional regulator [Candidatus Bathyarchaeia archaeon]
MTGLRNLRLILFAGLLVSMFVLTVKLLQPVSIQLMFDGQRIEFTQQPAFYALSDVVLAAASAFTAGACAVCLAVGVGEASEGANGLNVKADPLRVLEGITDQDERVVLGLVVESGGSTFQSDLVERSGFSKGKVSLVLDRLEARGIIQRKRSGMTNLITVIESH